MAAEDNEKAETNKEAAAPAVEDAGNAAPDAAADAPSPSWRPVASGDASTHRQIQIGDVLNHMFEVKRFIARGGMGEVFEGINVASEERVAIKVMLPALSADEKLLAMFRKEAWTLTRLNHPALVQYRVLAQEPQLGVFYIVTEFVDGKNLSDVIGELHPTPLELVQLMRRLAEGLGAAHALGAIHRDMSPDNVMLEQGKLSRARIIDFGIAKDLNANTATIIGDGFAGKLNYVAPEQLGDFNRQIGPWTDVYSLGLVILAVAAGCDVDMGGTLVNAVDKRRQGPDLSKAPEEMRPLLARMLKPNPEERLQSMDELLEALPGVTAARLAKVAASDHVEEDSRPETRKTAIVFDSIVPPKPQAEIDPSRTAVVFGSDALKQIQPVAPPVSAPPPASPASSAPPPEAATPTPAMTVPSPAPSQVPPPPPPPAAEPQAAPTQAVPTASAATGSSKLPLILVGIAVLVLLVAVAAWFALRGKGGDSANAGDAAAQGAPGGNADPAAVRAALVAGLPTVNCSWLDIADVSQKDGGTVVTLRGVASVSADAQGQIGKLLAAKDLKVSKLDFEGVAPIESSECAPLDALRQIRDPIGGHISVPQQQFEMTKMTSGQYAGSAAAMAPIEFSLGDASQEMALFGIEPSGKISQLTTERSELVGAADDLGGNRYRLTVDVNHTGWSGMLLLTGQKPFDGSLLSGPPGSRTGDWSDKFLSAARARGWKAEMVWFKTVDDQPN